MIDDDASRPGTGAWAKARGLHNKPGQLPPGQLKQLCKGEPQNALCTVKPGHPGGKGKR